MDMDITSAIFIVLITITTEQLMIEFSKKFKSKPDKVGLKIIIIVILTVVIVAFLMIKFLENEAWAALIHGTNLPSPIANWYTWGLWLILLISLAVFAIFYFKFANRQGVRFWIWVILSVGEVVYLIFYRLFISDPNKIVTNGTLQQLSIRTLEQAIAFFYHFTFLGIFFLIANVSLAIDYYLDSH